MIAYLFRDIAGAARHAETGPSIRRSLVIFQERLVGDPVDFPDTSDVDPI
jgi:hypothetical protein